MRWYLEPKSGLLVAINGESGLLLLIDVHQAKVVGTVSIGGHPEFAAVSTARVGFTSMSSAARPVKLLPSISLRARLYRKFR